MRAKKDFLKVVFNLNDASEHLIYAPAHRLENYFHGFSSSFVLFLIPATFLTYILLFLPLSYAGSYLIKQVFLSIIWLLFIMLMIGTILISSHNISYYRRYNSPKRSDKLNKRQMIYQRRLASIFGNIYLVSVFGIFGLYICLSVMRMVVEDYFPPIIIFISGLGIFSIYYLAIILNYKAYLLKILHVIQAIGFFIIINLISLMIGSIRGIFQVSVDDPVKSYRYGSAGLTIITSIILILLIRQIATRISLTGKRIHYVRTMIAFALVGLNLLYCLYFNLNFIIPLLPAVLMIGVMEYYDLNPTRIKSMVFLYIGAGLATLLFSFSLIGGYVFEKYPVIKVVEQILGLLTTLGIGLPIIGKAIIYVHKKITNRDADRRKGQVVSEEDVKEALQEINDEDYSINSISLFVNLAILTKRYDLIHKELLNWQKNPRINPDLKTYFQLYLFCAEYEHRDRRLGVRFVKPRESFIDTSIIYMSEDTAIDIRDDQIPPNVPDSDMILSQDFKADLGQSPESNNIPDNTTEILSEIELIVNRRKDFNDYLYSFLKNNCTLDPMIWSAVKTNPVIINNVDHRILELITPPSNSWVKKFVNRAILFLVFLLISIGMIPGLDLSSLPNTIQQIREWNTIRLDELRLKMVEAFAPYNCSPNCQTYYADSVLIWTDEWLDLHSEQLKESSVVSAADAEKALHWYSIIPSFYTINDEIYYASQFKIGNMYRLVGDCQSAIIIFNEVNQELFTPQGIDNLLYSEADCYMQQDNVTAAFQTLLPVDDLQGYPYSKKLLAELYFQSGNFAKTISLLEYQQDLSKHNLLLLGKAYIEAGNLENGIKTLSTIISQFDQNQSDSDLADAHLWLGEGYYRQENHFESASEYYMGLSHFLMYDTTVTQDYLTKLLPHFIHSIEAVQLENPVDNRTNLWFFVFYILSPNESDKAWNYFEKHLIDGNGYESGFTNWVIEQVNSKEY
jgi:tetratricopeptide (TPR) repeat protein